MSTSMYDIIDGVEYNPLYGYTYSSSGVEFMNGYNYLNNLYSQLNKDAKTSTLGNEVKDNKMLDVSINEKYKKVKKQEPQKVGSQPITTGSGSTKKTFSFNLTKKK